MARSSLVPCDFVWEKVKTIDFSETIVVKVGRRSKLNGPSSLRFNIFKLFSLETAGPPCTYMVKTLKNLLVWNQKADYLETWYAGIG